MAWPSARFKTALLGGDWTPSDMNGVQDFYLRSAGIQADDLEIAATRNLSLSTTAAGHGGAAVRRGKSVIQASGTRTNVAYGALSNGPDQVANLVLPNEGYIDIMYDALIRGNTTATTIGAAIFLGATQLSRSSVPAVVVDEGTLGLTEPGGHRINTDHRLVTVPGVRGNNAEAVTVGGLTIVSAGIGISPGFGAPVTTGQIMASALRVFLTAGTYTVSVQFKASGGSTVSASQRRLYVEAVAFE